MKIAIMGIRGIPANYGGFETFAEELAPRLVTRGHEVTVYGRSNIVKYQDPYYNGVRIKILPTISHKYFDTVVHTFLCALHSLIERYDVILICNSANSIFAWIPKVTNQKVAINVDGLEWKRKKWNILGTWFYKTSEYFATIFSNVIVSDAFEIKGYYLKKFKHPSTYIPYGAPVQRVKSKEILEKFDLKSREYILYVSRLEPENNAHLVINAFEKVKTNLKLVILGDAPYSTEYIKKLKSTSDPRIIFTGYVFGQGYREFQSNAYIYIQATEVGGTHPALLEGMGFGNCVLANDVPEHREVLDDTGMFFTTNKNSELTEKIQFLLDNQDVVKLFRTKAVERTKKHYTWDKITDGYENLFFKLIK